MDTASLGSTSALTTFGLFIAVAAAELIRPDRVLQGPTNRRWFGNLFLYLASGGLAMLPMIAAFMAAITSQATQIGLLNRLPLPTQLHFAIGILGLDALSYAFHRLYHRVGFLWRLHAVHHSDPELDVTTTLRHHPLEALVHSTLIAVAVLALGVSPAEIALYAWLEWTVQLLAHANIALPPRLTASLGRIIVTPGFHQLHHSRTVMETNSNYGQVFAFWDTLFGSARSHPAHDQRQIEFGLDEFRDARSQWAHRLFAQPILPRTAQPHALATLSSLGASAQAASGTTRKRSVSPVS